MQQSITKQTHSKITGSQLRGQRVSKSIGQEPGRIGSETLEIQSNAMIRTNQGRSHVLAQVQDSKGLAPLSMMDIIPTQLRKPFSHFEAMPQDRSTITRQDLEIIKPLITAEPVVERPAGLNQEQVFAVSAHLKKLIKGAWEIYGNAERLQEMLDTRALVLMMTLQEYPYALAMKVLERATRKLKAVPTASDLESLAEPEWGQICAPYKAVNHKLNLARIVYKNRSEHLNSLDQLQIKDNPNPRTAEGLAKMETEFNRYRRVSAEREAARKAEGPAPRRQSVQQKSLSDSLKRAQADLERRRGQGALS